VSQTEAEKVLQHYAPTAVTTHLQGCAKELNVQLRGTNARRRVEALRAVFKLSEAEWADLPEDMLLWRRGYEQCMIDVIEAIADEWGVALPVAPVPE
jgi:uncharacterized metal-binding protein YceD (DUF177 family)